MDRYARTLDDFVVGKRVINRKLPGEQWRDLRLARAHRDSCASLDAEKDNRLDKVVIESRRVGAQLTLTGEDRIGRNIDTRSFSSCCVSLDNVEFLQYVAVSI